MMTSINTWLSKILVIGIFLSVLFVFAGGGFFLYEHGFDPLQTLPIYHEPTPYRSIIHFFQHLIFSSRTIIEFGLFILVMTQIARVIITLGFFIHERDKIFILMTGFILLTIGSSFFA